MCCAMYVCSLVRDEQSLESSTTASSEREQILVAINCEASKLKDPAHLTKVLELARSLIAQEKAVGQ